MLFLFGHRLERWAVDFSDLKCILQRERTKLFDPNKFRLIREREGGRGCQITN